MRAAYVVKHTSLITTRSAACVGRERDVSSATVPVRCVGNATATARSERRDFRLVSLTDVPQLIATHSDSIDRTSIDLKHRIIKHPL